MSYKETQYLLSKLSLSDEESHLPSVLYLDDIQFTGLPPRSPWKYRLTLLLAWILCITLGIICGAGLFTIQAILTYQSPSAASTNSSLAFPPFGHHQFQSLSLTPGLRDSLLQLSPETRWNHTQPPPSPCGNKPDTARDAGCIFGLGAYAWYPPSCFDSVVENEFLANQDSKWYSELEAIGKEQRLLDGGEGFSRTVSGDLVPWTELSHREVLAGEHEVVYMDSVYYAGHCDFVQRKMWRAVMSADVSGEMAGEHTGGVFFDNYMLRRGHDEFCARRLDSRSEGPVKVVMKYLDCIKP